ncbi:MAG: hypothetical protein IKC32_07765 [Clostridia bacterium]|nr:hypothetical protein [Clostridia bacterium]
MKRLISLILMLTLLALTPAALTSCTQIEGVLDSFVGNAIKLDGIYECIHGDPAVSLSFSDGRVDVKMGRRSMSGSYSTRSDGDGGYVIIFDFGQSTSLLGGIGTGRQPISVGVQAGIDYILIFGIRYNKVS